MRTILGLVLAFLPFYPFSVRRPFVLVRPVVVAVLVRKKQNYVAPSLLSGLDYVAYAVAPVFAAVVPLKLAVLFAALV